MSFGNEREFIDFQQLEERREQAMKCPLLRVYKPPEHYGDAIHDRDCLREGCALWEKGINECGFHAIKEALQMIAICLREIKDKMPHAGQFTK